MNLTSLPISDRAANQLAKYMLAERRPAPGPGHGLPGGGGPGRRGLWGRKRGTAPNSSVSSFGFGSIASKIDYSNSLV